MLFYSGNEVNFLGIVIVLVYNVNLIRLIFVEFVVRYMFD